MVKLLGSMCILGGGFYIRWIHLREGRGEEETLAALSAALEEMAQEIRLTRTPLPLLLGRMEERRRGNAAAFFAAVSAALDTGESPGAAWCLAAGALPLTREDRAALAEAGSGLHGDEEQICKGMTLAARQLAESLAEKRRCRPEKEKRTTALCFSAAALLVILLI